MADATMNALFGPLSRKYCVWFYWLSVIGFVFLVYLVISGLWVGLTMKVNKVFFYQLFASALMYLIFYFQNRLLYTMCSGSA
jgi:hypothetical protein